MPTMELPEIETKRLLLRQFTPADLDEYTRIIFADPDVTRFLPKRDIPPRQRAERVLNNFGEHWLKHGYGDWAVTDRVHGQLIGHCGLNFIPEAGEVEVEYSIAKPYWGQGIATEAARASVRFGFEALHLERIIALADPQNIASWRVMEKVGLVYQKDVFFFGMQLVYYQIMRLGFQAGNLPYHIVTADSSDQNGVLVDKPGHSNS
jgi:ribosomal-protein-alanine N-acetyltransferase